MNDDIECHLDEDDDDHPTIMLDIRAVLSDCIAAGLPISRLTIDIETGSVVVDFAVVTRH